MKINWYGIGYSILDWTLTFITHVLLPNMFNVIVKTMIIAILWNSVVVKVVTGVTPVTFFQAMGLYFVCGLLFKSRSVNMFYKLSNKEEKD